MALRFNPFKLGKVCAIVWGLFLFGYTWWLILFRAGRADPHFIGFAYYHYSITPVGSLIGLCWGCIDGFVAGMMFALFYNWLKHSVRK